jgi:hypothetical protein
MLAPQASCRGGQLARCAWQPCADVTDYEVVPGTDDGSLKVFAYRADGTRDSVTFTVPRTAPRRREITIPEDVGVVEFRGQEPVVADGMVMLARQRSLCVDGIEYKEGQELTIGGRVARVLVISDVVK